MKKLLIATLIIALMLTAAACSTQTPETPEPSQPEDISGGWLVPEAAAVSMPEEAQAAFDAAMEDLTGVGYTPIAFLGSQVVAGVNYAYLCRAIAVTPDAAAYAAVVTVFADLDGVCQVSNVKTVNASDYVGSDAPEFAPEATGGWSLEAVSGTALDTDASAAFAKATDGMAGVGYEPLAVLGTQVVAGINYTVLCKATTVTAEPASALAVLVIHADPAGNAEISGIAAFTIAD